MIGARRTVAYVTDVEGKWNKLSTFAAENPHVTIDPAGRLEVAPDAVFVFGGDAIDRGPDGQRVMATLLEAKTRQPEQVVLIAGNRDINKMRLGRELAGHPPLRAPEEIKAGPRHELLQWILSHTMGAKAAFEMRRQELATSGRGAGEDEVAESFVAEVAPDGLLTRYLARGQLLYRHELTLFVHGAVTHESLGHIPGEDRALGVDEWISRLNAWYARSVAAYVDQAHDERGEPQWEALVAYQAPLRGTRLNQASVVYGRLTDDAGNPYLPEQSVIDALRQEGIRRLVAGHTPAGDSPAILRDRGFELVLADNSYGRIEDGSKVFIRGTEIEVSGTTLLDGGERESVAMTLDIDDVASRVGLRDLDSGELVKGRLARGDYLLFKGLPGFAVEQHAESEEGMARRRLGPPRRG